MKKQALGVLIGLFGCVLVAHAQEATERFIPLGKSPGLSGVQTVIGEVQGTDTGARTMTVAADGRSHSIAVTERTKIWIDRTPAKLGALSGKFYDCEPGSRVEVKFLDEKDKREAEWVKIQKPAS